MAEPTLFPVGDSAAEAAAPPAAGRPRLVALERDQVLLQPACLEDLLPEEHPARAVWDYVAGLDLSAWLNQVRAVEGGPGRPAFDPRVLLALWLYATLEAVGSARHLADLCVEHVAYTWLCGGQPVNYHTLADFRSESEAELNELLTESVARLQAEGLVSMTRVATDGLRVRASAGRASFHRAPTLAELREEATAQVAALRRELEATPEASRSRQAAARLRGKQERAARVAHAAQECELVRAQKKHNKEEARASVTDPEARKMHMPDGGFRPAYNVQYTSDTATGMILGAAVLSVGSDGGQLRPAVQQLEERYGVTPKEILVDGGYVKAEDIEALATAERPCTVYAPVPELKTHDGRPIAPAEDEAPAVKEWRARMQTEAAQEIYGERFAVAEGVNAFACNHGLRQFPVRGRERAQAVVLLVALASNLMSVWRLRKESG